MHSDRVLIVDKSAESREVLCALLARSGTASIEASRAAEAVSLAQQLRPQLIVLDADSDPSTDRQATRDLTAAARRTNTPIVLLGKITGAEIAFDPSELLAKPYHYGQLIRRIEGVLEQRRAA
jgi:DNA-binding response OmpR family regulator